MRSATRINGMFATAALASLLALGGCTDAAAPDAGSAPTEPPELVEITEHEAAEDIQEQVSEEEAEEATAPTAEDYQAQLDAAVADLEARGASISYCLIDLATGDTLEHNADAVYYSASTIKAPFCISLLRDQGANARSAHGGTIEATVSNSDNEAYRTLRKAYVNYDFYRDLANEAGAPCDLTHWYNYYGARDLANLWRASYAWLTSGDENATWIAGLLTNTLNSRVDDIASGPETVTWSKAGWYAGGGPEYDVTFDGGIVNAPYGAYAIAVATNRGSDFKAIESVMTPLVGLWNARHAS